MKKILFDVVIFLMVAFLCMFIGLVALPFVTRGMPRPQRTIPVKQVIDCWKGYQIITPHVRFLDQSKLKGRFCLVEPNDDYLI